MFPRSLEFYLKFLFFESTYGCKSFRDRTGKDGTLQYLIEEQVDIYVRYNFLKHILFYKVPILRINLLCKKINVGRFL